MVERQEPRNSRIIKRRQRCGDNALAHHARHRRFDEHRLVEQLADLEAWRGRGAGNLQHGAYPVDHIEGRSVAVLDDAEQNGALAILPDDVLLHRRAVANLADVLDEDRRAVGELDRNIVELVDRARRGVGAHGVLRVGDLHLARRQRQVLRIDRVHHVERRQPAGEQFVRVDIDHDLAVFAAGRRGKGNAWHRRQLLAQAINAVVVKLLLVEIVRGERELQHGHARGIELHDDRRLDAWRHERTDGIRGRDDLRDCQVEIDVRLKVDLLHRDAVKRLRLHVLDAVDVGADRILAVGGDPLLHLWRAEAGVAPDDGHDRDVDLRKDIGRHRADGGDAKKHDQRGEHVEGVRKPECEPNDAHDLACVLASLLLCQRRLRSSPALRVVAFETGLFRGDEG